MVTTLSENPFHPRRVGVIGGGTAGCLTALALKEWRPDLDVTLLYSPKIPIIGVGEATTPPLVAFLHGYLGLDPHRFFRDVAPTWKLGIRFEWGAQGLDHFNYAFGPGDLVDAQAHDGHLGRYCMSSLLMDAGAAPLADLAGQTHSLLPQTRLAYHLDNARFVKALEARCDSVGIARVAATITEVETGEAGVTALTTEAGARHAFDLYVDCSGFKALLNEALGVPFVSYAEQLWSDAAIVCDAPHDGVIKPYTTATTMPSGWRWTIPTRDADHLGYVYASRFVDSDAAEAELRAAVPNAGDARIVRFKTGRRADFVRDNVVSIGNAYGFVEPLESTALHMVVIGVSRLLGLLTSGGRGQERANTQMAGHWDFLRDFLALHYRFNTRLDTPFWTAARKDVGLGSLDAAVADFRTGGPFSARPKPPRFAADSVFGVRGLDVMLLGQGVVPDRVRGTVALGDWAELCAMRETVVQHALPHAAALERVGRERSWLDGLHTDEASWAVEMATQMRRVAPTCGRAPAAIAAWADEHEVQVRWPHAFEAAGGEFPHTPSRDFGKFLHRVPDMVFRPRDQQQLAACLRLCHDRGIPVKVRGAGHSSGGQTLIEDGAVIDLRWLRRVIADDPETETITVDGGAWWLDVCAALHAQSRRPPVLTDNWRSTVGGTLAVGGFGDRSHVAGLQIDHVHALVLTAIDGTRHTVGPGDPRFDLTLAGRGQLGVISAVVLPTIRRPTTLTARVLSWPSVEDFLEDARIIADDGRFEYLRARVQWEAGAPVKAAAGNFTEDAARAGALDGLRATASRVEQLDYYAKSIEPPEQARWQAASPSIEVILPTTGDLAAFHAIHQRVCASDLPARLPNGSSLMLVKRQSQLPLAPLPAGELGMMFAIRPEMPLADVPAALPLLQELGRIGVAGGGRRYLMSIPDPDATVEAGQLGDDALARLRALKAEMDPHGLLNPGLL